MKNVDPEEQNQLLGVQSSKRHLIQEYKYSRWLVLLISIMLQFSNNQQQTSFAPIPDQSVQYYNQDMNMILWLSNSTSFGPIFFSYLGVILVDLNLELSLLISNAFNFLGFYLRYIGQRNIWFCLTGQIIGSIAQIFYQTGSIIISEKYFTETQQFIIINIQQQANFLGNSIGYLISLYYVEQNAMNIDKMNKLSLLIAIVPMLLVLLITNNISIQQIKKNHSQLQLKQNLQYITQNKEYILSTLLFSFALSNSWSYISVINNYLISQDLNFTFQQIGIINLYYSLSGFITGVLASYFIEKHPRLTMKYFDTIIKVMLIVMFISTNLFLCFYQNFTYQIHIIVHATMGGSSICLISFISVAIIENHYPYSESITTNGIFFLGNIISLITTLLSLIPFWIFQYTYSFNFIPTIIYVFCYHQTKFRKTKAIHNI